VSTARAAWADTQRTQEAPVVLEGGGLVNIPRADAPLLFTDPVSLSYGDLNISRGARSSGQLVRLVDAGGGAGTWQLDLSPRAAPMPSDLKPTQTGAPRTGTSLVDVYRYPSEPFGPPPTYVGKPMDESGAEQVYVTHLNEPAANLGVAVEAASQNSQIDPWLL